MASALPAGWTDRMAHLAPPAVVAYADALDAALVGPRRVRQGLVREASDHLLDATAAYQDTGYEEDEAASLAIREFGTVADIAPAFQTTLAVVASRRTAWLMLSVLIVQPFLWDRGLRLGELGGHGYGAAFAVLDVLTESAGFLVLLGSAAAVIATGLGNRWGHAGHGVARATGGLALAGCAVLPTLAVAMLLASGGGTPILWQLMFPLMLLPMAVTAAAARRCLVACRHAADLGDAAVSRA
jgi:hypothetical protein